MIFGFFSLFLFSSFFVFFIFVIVCSFLFLIFLISAHFIFRVLVLVAARSIIRALLTRVCCVMADAETSVSLGCLFEQ